MQPTGQLANMKCCTFTGIIFAKETHFCPTFWLGQPTQLMCAIYKFSLTSGLTLHLCLIFIIIRSSCSCSINFHFLYISLIQFQVVLCFSIYSTIICFDLVTLRFLTETYDCGWIPFSIHRVQVHDTLTYMKVMSGYSCTEFSSPWQFRSFCLLAAFDMSRLDLAALLLSICIGDCKVLDNGVLQYTIKHWYKSLPSSFCFMGKFFTICTYFSANPLDCG